MDMILDDATPDAVVTAIEGNLNEMVPAFGYVPSVEVIEDPDAYWTISNIPYPMFNIVVRCTAEPAEVDTVIDRLMSRYRSRYVPVLWRVGPSSSPPDLAQRLEARGFIDVGTLKGFAVDLNRLGAGPTAARGLTIRKVAGLSEMHDWRQVVMASAELPRTVVDEYAYMFGVASFRARMPLHHYVGFVGTVPVATSTLFLGAGVAGLHNVMTVPEYRGRGFATALSLAPLHEARDRGFKFAILESEEDTERLYRRLGFEEYCRTKGYAWLP